MAAEPRGSRAPAGDDAGLRDAAFRAMEHAYAPYSGFRVGAALADEGGRVAAGCNVENSSYPAGNCAERGAVSAMIVAGGTRVHALVVATEAHEPTPPCGICRQVLAEFADPALEVVSVTRAGREARWAMADLLPAPFTPAFLGRR